MSIADSRRGLGRGLDVLIGGGEGATLADLPIDSIRPNARQPRRRFDPEATSGLAGSLRAHGVLQPVVVRPLRAGGYELVAGERRWRAAREAGMATVPAVVRDTGDRDSLLLALVENVAREQLSPIEEARAYAVLLDEFGLSLGELAARVGRSKSSVSNRVRLLELPDDVLELVEGGDLSEGHARAVLAVPQQDRRRALARRIVRHGLSVRAAERAAREDGGATRRRRPGAVDPALASRAKTALEQLTGRTPIVTPGRVELAFSDEHDLAELVESLERAAGGPTRV